MPLEAPVPAWGGRRAVDALARVRAIGEARGLPCHICRGGALPSGGRW